MSKSPDKITKSETPQVVSYEGFMEEADRRFQQLLSGDKGSSGEVLDLDGTLTKPFDLAVSTEELAKKSREALQTIPQTDSYEGFMEEADRRFQQLLSGDKGSSGEVLDLDGTLSK